LIISHPPFHVLSFDQPTARLCIILAQVEEKIKWFASKGRKKALIFAHTCDKI